MERHLGNCFGIVILMTVLGMQVVPARAGSEVESLAFGKPVPLSGGGDGWEGAAGIDAQGNAVALWDERTSKSSVQDHLWSKERPVIIGRIRFRNPWRMTIAT